MSVLIRTGDLIESVADALQYISIYHTPDYLVALAEAHAAEQAPAARDAIAQMLANSRMAAEGRRPICSDTGIVTIFVKWGQSCLLDGTLSLQDAIDEGVRRAYRNKDNPLRASILRDPAFGRVNTRDNTPCVLHVEMTPGDTVELSLAAKGGGSENKSRLIMMNPGDDIADWVVRTVPTLGAGWCPPGMLGIGVGGTAEKAMLLAKQSLMAPINMAQLLARGPATQIEALRIEIFERVNALGVGAQGLGGLATVLDVKILDWPTHAASKPVGLIPNCVATRHAHISLDGSGPTFLTPPALSDWPAVGWAPDHAARRVDLDRLTPDEVRQWRRGERLLLSGRLLTGRDAAHKRIGELVASGATLPISLDGRAIFYVGPVDPVRDEAVGPAGPTTATRMDGFTDMILDQGILAMIGKAERGPEAIEAIKRHGAAYLIGVGGAAYLVSRAVRSSRVLAFADLGMEAIFEFEVEDMPVMVAVDAEGGNVHHEGPLVWRRKLKQMRGTGAS